MLRTAISNAPAVQDALPISASPSRWKRIAFVFLLSGVLGCLPARGHSARLDCPEMGAGAVPNLLSDVQVKLVTSGNRVDVANEINDLVNKLEIDRPNISYDELTDVLIAAYCPAVANMANLTASEKWRRMRQFDTILQQQLAANVMPQGSLLHDVILHRGGFDPTLLTELERLILWLLGRNVQPVFVSNRPWVIKFQDATEESAQSVFTARWGECPWFIAQRGDIPFKPQVTCPRIFGPSIS
jgi:hypothetical protein